LAAAPTVLAFFSGGYSAKPQLLALAASFAVLGVLLAAAPWPLVGTRTAHGALAALAAMATWTGLSILWARVLDDAANETAQLALYTVVFGAAVIVLRYEPVRRASPPAVLAGIFVVALYAMAVRLLPDLLDVVFSARAGERSEQPLGYWNALGLLMALGILLSAAVAGDAERRLSLRMAACAAAVPCMLTLYLTFSRGSLMALAAGFVVLILARPRRATLLSGGLALAAGVLLALALQLFPAVLNVDEGIGPQTSQGTILLVLVIALTAAVALAFGRLSRSAAWIRPLRVRREFRGGVALASVVALLAVGWTIAFGDERTEPLTSSEKRLTTLTTNRGAYWRVALDAWVAHPLTGVGAGSFVVEWRRERTSGEYAVDAHSLYIETLGELGLVGGALLAAFLAAVILGLVRRVRDPGDAVAPAAAACITAFLVQVALDWTWELPAVTLIFLVFAAAAVQAPRGARA
jgi:hypothetical protein